jgi:hypothetical protein
MSQVSSSRTSTTGIAIAAASAVATATTTATASSSKSTKAGANQLQRRSELEAAEKYHDAAEAFFLYAQQRHASVEREWNDATALLRQRQEQLDAAKKFLSDTQTRLQVITVDDDEEEEEEVQEDTKHAASASRATTRPAAATARTRSNAAVGANDAVIDLDGSTSDDEGSSYSSDPEYTDSSSPNIVTPIKKKRKRGGGSGAAPAAGTITTAVASADQTSIHPPPRRQPTTTKRHKNNSTTTRATEEASSSPDWLPGMQHFLLHVPHGTRQPLKIVSEANTRMVLRQVKRLASGVGITYKHWPAHVAFGRGRPITDIRTTDFVAWGNEAKAFEERNGRDLGNGWLLKHPITKLQVYQNYLLEQDQY